VHKTSLGVLACLGLYVSACAGPALEGGDAGTGSAAEAAPTDAVKAASPIKRGSGRAALAASPTCTVDTSLADFQAGVATSCDATTSPGDVTLATTPLLNQQNTSVTTNGFGFTATSWAGQTFVPSASGPLNRVDLDLFCSGCSGTTPNLAVSIRATTGSPAVPTGPDLATATITGFSNGTGTYFTASFATPVAVTAGTAYAVIMHPVANPSAGVYAYVCSCTTSTNPYTLGSRVTSSNSGTSWTADITAGGRDMGFSIFIGSGYATSGTFASSGKDASPAVGDTVHWTSLSWNATAPASATLQFQAAASNDPAGPFSFVGPDGTASTFFTSGDSLAQFDGNRYLEYKALFATSDTSQTATLQDVTTCFSTSPSTVSTSMTVAPATGVFGGTANLAATLSASGSGLAGRSVSFSFNAAAMGNAMTDAQGLATISGVGLTGVEPGVYAGAVVATYDGETGFAASSGSSDLTVSRATQAITFAALPGKLMTDGAFSVSATGGASGNPVTFSTASPACSVTGSTVTLVAGGTCAIQADQAGNTEYFAATPVTQSFTISLASQTITFPAIASFSWSGGSATLAASASSSLAVAYSVQSGPCSVAGSTLTATTAGTCVVAANQAGNASYSAAAQVTASATVTQAGQTISFGPLADKLMTDGAFSVAATGGASGNPVTFSTTSAACSVTGTTVTLVSTGTCAVQADQAGNANYSAAAPVTRSFTIARASQIITFPAIASFSWSGGSADLVATASSTLAVAYSVQSGPCSVAGGTLTATAAGTCVVAANQAGNGNYSPAPQVTASATVTATGQTISFGPLDGKLTTDGSFALTATGGASGNPVTFSTTSAACSVTGTTVTLASAGTCAIHANQAGNANYNAASPVTQSFTISRAPQTITFPAITAFSWVGGSATLAATASSALAVTYSVVSGPCSLAGVVLTASAAGSCVVAADQAGDGTYAPAPRATTTATVGATDQTITFPDITSFTWNGGSASLAATASSGLPVSYSVLSGPCAVTGSTLTATGAGSCVVAADQAGSANYTAAPRVISSATATRADQTILFGALPGKLATDPAFALTATSDSPNPVVFSTSSPACTVSGATLTLVSSGDCTVRADQPEDANYNAASPVVQSFTVSLAPQLITFPAPTTFSWGGGSATLAATASSALAVTYSVRSGPCIVAGNTVTATTAGSCVVAADQAGDERYQAAPHTSVTVTVTKADQVILFPTVGEISSGSGPTVLRATATSGLPVSYHVVSGPCSIAATSLIATAAGTCVVTADQEGSPGYNAAAQVSVSVTVSQRAISGGGCSATGGGSAANLALLAMFGAAASRRRRRAAR